MAEALAGLSLASNIAQFVAMGLKASVFLLQAYKAGDGLVHDQAQLRAMVDGLKECLETLEAATEFAPTNALGTMYRHALDICRKMNQEFDKLDKSASASATAGWWRATRLRRATRATWKRSEIEGLMKKLESFSLQIVLQLQLSAELSRRALHTSAASTNLAADARNYNSQSTARLGLLHSKLCDLEQAVRTEPNEDAVARLEVIAIEARNASEYALSSKRVESILQSLHFQQIVDRQSEIKEAHRSTFRWALSPETTPLSEWLAVGSGIFWVEGKAGSGKSTLMKFLEREPQTTTLLKSWAGDKRLLVGSYYFWSQGAELQRVLSGLFRTLLFQILVKYPELLSTVCPERMELSGFRYLESWTLEQLYESFRRLSQHAQLPLKACFFIDGLDEYQGNTGDLIEIIKAISHSHSIKLCVSSRPWVEFREAFGHLSSHIRVHDHTREDIESYITETLCENKQYLQMQRETPQQASFFGEEVATKSDGVFLWVYLAVNDLLRGLQYKDDFATLTKRLKELPQDLEHYFRRIFNSIESVYTEEVSTILRMLSCSQGSLDVRVIWAYREFKVFCARFEQVTGMAPDSKGYHRALFGNFDITSASRPQFNITACNLSVEEQRIVARCRDLVHVWRTPLTEVRVGFLHRSVADFLHLPEIENIIKASTKQDFDPRTALGQAYAALYLLLSDTRDKNKLSWNKSVRRWEKKKHTLPDYVLESLQLAREAKAYSSTQCSEILSTLTFAVFACEMNSQLWPELDYHHEDYFAWPSQKYSVNYDDYVLSPIMFLSLMIDTIEIAPDTSQPPSQAVMDPASRRRSNVIEGVISLLSGTYNEPVLATASFYHIIRCCLLPQHRLALNQSELVLQFSGNANLTSLARAFELAEKWQVELNYHDVWYTFLCRTISQIAQRSAFDNFDIDRYESSLSLIRLGAPRYVSLSQQQRNDLVASMSSVRFAESEATIDCEAEGLRAVDTAIILEKLFDQREKKSQLLIQEFKSEGIPEVAENGWKSLFSPLLGFMQGWQRE